MSSKVDSTHSNLIKSSFWGILRGLSVETLIYPLEVVKIRQQCLRESEKSILIARRLLTKEGFEVFYKGLFPQLLKTSLKQAWCWPMITGVPECLQSHGINEPYQYILTGISIATVDAMISTPLERVKIVSAFTGKSSFSFKNLNKDGWHGITVYWARRSVNMVTFLTFQKYLRDRNRKQSEELSLLELSKIGTQTALFVSIVSAPLDIANTLKQVKNLSLLALLSRQRVRGLYRGWPLSALSIIIHSIASVIIIEKLGRDSHDYY